MGAKIQIFSTQKSKYGAQFKYHRTKFDLNFCTTKTLPFCTRKTPNTTDLAPPSRLGTSPNSRNRTCVILSELFDRVTVIRRLHIPEMSAVESEKYHVELLCVSHLVSPEDTHKKVCTLFFNYSTFPCSPRGVRNILSRHRCRNLHEVPDPGPHTMFSCTWYLNAQCAVWSALSTQHTVNFEYSNVLSTQCTRRNRHSPLSATHLLGTKVPVRTLCVVPCARESRRPPWSSLSLSLPLTRALPCLDLPVSVLSCDVRRYIPKPSGANWNQLIPVVIG